MSSIVDIFNYKRKFKSINIISVSKFASFSNICKSKLMEIKQMFGGWCDWFGYQLI